LFGETDKGVQKLVLLFYFYTIICLKLWI